MAKNKISEWSSTPANNTDVGGIDIAEGCAPSGINNAIREMMAQVKDMITGADGDNFTVGGNLAVTGTSAFTGAINANGGVVGDVTGDLTGNADTATTAGTLSSTLAVNKGGTGVTTSTGTGSVVLSNSPTLVTPALGTPSALVATNATGTANSLNAGIGVNQTWKVYVAAEVGTERKKNTTYTNSTGKPIMVVLSGFFSGGTFSIDGVVVGYQNGTQINQSTYIIPNGSTYSTTLNPYYWAELS